LQEEYVLEIEAAQHDEPFNAAVTKWLAQLGFRIIFQNHHRRLVLGEHPGFGRQNEFSSRHQRLVIKSTMLLPLQPQNAPCFCRVPFKGAASANFKTITEME
jgi:hypothetical protein